MIIFIFYQVATRGLYHHQPREDIRSSSQVSEIGSQAGWVSDRRGQDSQMSDTQVADNMRQENQMMDQRVMQDSQMSEAVMGCRIPSESGRSCGYFLPPLDGAPPIAAVPEAAPPPMGFSAALVRCSSINGRY